MLYAQTRKRFVHDSFVGVFRHFPRLKIGRATHAYHVFHAIRKRGRVILRNVGNATCNFFLRVRVKRFVIKKDASRMRLEKAHDALEQRAFSGAIRA